MEQSVIDKVVYLVDEIKSIDEVLQAQNMYSGMSHRKMTLYSGSESTSMTIGDDLFKIFIVALKRRRGIAQQELNNL